MKAAGLVTGLARNMFFAPNHPALLVLFVTDRCNCRCEMCFNADNVFAAKRAPDLSMDAIARIAQSVRPLPQLLLSGGEPFLRSDIADIVAAFHDASGTRQVSIPTNGTLPDRIPAMCLQILERCPDLVLNINLSVDSIGEQHDAFRGLPGCFSRLCETHDRLRELRDARPNLTVNIITVFTETNIGDAANIIREIGNRFTPNYHAIGLLRNDLQEHRTNDVMDRLEATVDLEAFERQSFRKLPVFGRLAPALATLVKKLAVKSRRERRRCFTCLAGRKIVVVTNDGRLMPCEPLWLEADVRRHEDPDHYLMANLADHDYNVAAALKTDAARRVQAFVKTRQCWCSYACAIQNGILYSPRMYPLLLAEIALGAFSKRPGKMGVDSGKKRA